MENRQHSDSDLTMNGIFLNIINGFFFAFSTTLMFIGENLSTITASLSLVFLVLLNARKVAIETRKIFRIVTGKDKLDS